MEAVASKTKVERRKRVLRAALLAAVAVARRIKGGPAGRSGETLKLTWSRAVSSNASMAGLFGRLSCCGGTLELFVRAHF